VVEPYVVAADVYSEAAHVGRGGWTWYTGSAGWMYRVGIENILGLKRRGNALIVEPCIPSNWKQYQMHYRFGSTRYEITVENPEGRGGAVLRVEVDGKVLKDREIRLRDDGNTHLVRVVLGQETRPVPITTKATGNARASMIPMTMKMHGAHADGGIDGERNPVLNPRSLSATMVPSALRITREVPHV
jgi:hypothetical protein